MRETQSNRSTKSLLRISHKRFGEDKSSYHSGWERHSQPTESPAASEESSSRIRARRSSQQRADRGMTTRLRSKDSGTMTMMAAETGDNGSN